MRKLAARFGAEPIAVEGCVRETFGAAVAAWQGEWAQDRAARRAMRSIAVDEAEHASLGWAVDAWARGVLRSDERARLEVAREAARLRLTADAMRPVARELTTTLGLPEANASARLLAALSPLWA